MASRSRARGADEVDGERAGDRAEREAFERLRAALPPDYRLFPNVRWLGRTAVGLSRARQHVAAIVTPEVANRLGRIAS